MFYISQQITCTFNLKKATNLNELTLFSIMKVILI